MPLQPGERLGPYEILAPIGSGGMGEVWKARDTRLNRIVAIKRLKSQYSDRFEQEAHAIAALNHSNICQIHDIGPDYLVMEYVEGKPLSGPLPVEDALKLAVQIASAMEEAHSKGILHRDLKPANILVTGKGSAKILDFGLAKLMTERDADATKTIERAIVGTAAYMAPEQAEGKPLDQRSDVFSFGAVLYEVLSGSRAFRGSSTATVLSAVLRDEPAPLQAPSEFQRIVTKCLAKQPAQRFQSMAEVSAALEQASTKAAPQQPSIAVLPFANMSAEKDSEYFSDGLAEEILNLLAKIPGLKVIARTSSFAFRGKEQDITRIAETLRVATILEGSVRRAGTRIRVTAQLIDAADGSHLWSERYDRELANVFEVQDEIAEAIASALKVKLAPTGAPYKPSLPAYEALLKARYYFAHISVQSLPHMKECYEQAIALDAKFALAHCEFGYYFVTMAIMGALPADQAMPQVRSHAQQALDLDPSLPEGHAMLGLVSAAFDYDWKEAERRFHLALAGERVPTRARWLYATHYLLPIGRPRDAIQQLELAMQEDPLNLFMQLIRAICFFVERREEQATRAFREVLELNPNVAAALGYLGMQHVARGELNQARALLEQGYALTPKVPNGIGAMAAILKLTGDLSRSEELLRTLLPGDSFGAPRGLAVYHWMLREFDAVAEWTGKAIDQRDPGALTMLWHTVELRSSPHWAALMRKLNLPEA